MPKTGREGSDDRSIPDSAKRWRIGTESIVDTETCFLCAAPRAVVVAIQSGGADGDMDREAGGDGIVDETTGSGHGNRNGPRGQRKTNRRPSKIRRRLYTATILYVDGCLTLQAFHASIARSPTTIIERLRRRFGEDLIPLADIRIGFHGSAPMVIALVPHGLRALIRQVEGISGMPAVRRFTVDLEQRVEL